MPSTRADAGRLPVTVCDRARQFPVEEDLVSIPADERCDVIPAPAAVRAILAVACYLSPPMFKPSRDGFFFVPYPVDHNDPEEVDGLLECNAPYSVATTAVHEAYPGHHWHLMTMKAARPIRRLFTSTYFVEGWALYTEAMMRDAGFFTPEEELGQLEARLLRAARIVVDTSHLRGRWRSTRRWPSCTSGRCSRCRPRGRRWPGIAPGPPRRPPT